MKWAVPAINSASLAKESTLVDDQLLGERITFLRQRGAFFRSIAFPDGCSLERRPVVPSGVHIRLQYCLGALSIGLVRWIRVVDVAEIVDQAEDVQWQPVSSDIVVGEHQRPVSFLQTVQEQPVACCLSQSMFSVAVVIFEVPVGGSALNSLAFVHVLQCGVAVP